MNKELPKNAKAKVQNLLAVKQRADQNLQLYIEGCMDGLNLKGDWNFDTRNLCFVKMPDKKEAE